MSYEGYYQLICEKGHYFTVDCYMHHPHMACPLCGKSVAWWNIVDTTNDEGKPVELEVILPQLSRTCPTCGQLQVIKLATYKIPLDAGWTGNGFDYDDLDSGHDAQHDEQSFIQPEE